MRYPHYMPQPPNPAPARPLRGRSLRLGFLAVTDAAPLVAAEELGLFARQGLNVELRREIGWATVRDKLIYGELDAAQAPAPLLWSIQLGLGCTPCPVCTPLVLSLHGNALTLSQSLWAAGVRDGPSLRTHLQHRARREPVTFGVGFLFSSAHLLLRDWLRSAGIDPEREVRIVVVPPAQMYRHLTAATLDGYYTAEPWNSVAVQSGGGWCPVISATQQPGHIEKVLITTSEFSDRNAGETTALVTALIQAGAWCSDLQNREKLAEMLAQSRYLNLPVAALAPSLSGKFDCGKGQATPVAPFHLFSGGDTNIPTAAKAASIQRALGAAGLLPTAAATDASLPARLFREDIYHQATGTPARPNGKRVDSRLTDAHWQAKTPAAHAAGHD